ncbi:MAG: hypothetical protein AAF702_24265 [Chloroflexota bacterium]
MPSADTLNNKTREEIPTSKPATFDASTVETGDVVLASTDRHQLFATFFEQLYLAKEVYTYEDQIVLHWPKTLQAPANYVARLQHESGRIYAEIIGEQGESGDRVFTQALSIPDGVYTVILMPDADEYYKKGIRVEHKIPLAVVRADYRSVPYAPPPQRVVEMLHHAIVQSDKLFAETAKMAAGWWDKVKPERILDVVDTVNQLKNATRIDGQSLLYLLGLTGMVNRFGKKDEFSPVLRQQIEHCICSFPYSRFIERLSSTRLVNDGAQETHLSSHTEPLGLDSTGQLLLFTCELLAGQYTQQRLANDNEGGEQHLRQGEIAVLQWLRHAASYGFVDLSSHGMAHLVVALTHLIDFADSEPIWEMAAIVMDKVMVTMALSSFQGVYGSECLAENHGDLMGLSGHLSPLAGIARLQWGMGTWNRHIAGPVSLACCENYEQPSLITALAVDRPEGMWATEYHTGVNVALGEGLDAEPGSTIQTKSTSIFTAPTNLESRAEADALNTALQQYENHVGIKKSIYKTADFLLTAVQGIEPEIYREAHRLDKFARPKNREAVWQATMGPDAVVFVRYSKFCQPNANSEHRWQEGLVPRIAHYQDCLLALYRLPAEEVVGFTYVNFPTYAFDEYQVRKQWAFAVHGDAYLALASSHPLELVREGQTAYRELRVYGSEVVWLCQMGSKSVYGSFDEFRKQILKSRLVFTGLSVNYTGPSGEALAFGWDSALQVNGQSLQHQSQNHYDGPYCTTDGWPANQMIVTHEKDAMQLGLTT